MMKKAVTKLNLKDILRLSNKENCSGLTLVNTSYPMHLLLLAVLSGGSSRVFPLCSHFKEPKQSVEFLSAESDVTADGIHKKFK